MQIEILPELRTQPRWQEKLRVPSSLLSAGLAPRARRFPKNYNNECLNQLSRANFAFATTSHVNMEVALYKVEEWEPPADWVDRGRRVGSSRRRRSRGRGSRRREGRSRRRRMSRTRQSGGGGARGIHESQMRWIRPSLPYFCFRGRWQRATDYRESSAGGAAGLGIK